MLTNEPLCFPKYEARDLKKLLYKALSWCRAQGTDAIILWLVLEADPLSPCGLVDPADIFEVRHAAARLPRSLARQNRS